MKSKNWLSRLYKRTWTRKFIMTDRSLRLVILVAAIAGATTAVLATRTIKKMILKITTSKPSEASDQDPTVFHETVCSAEFSESCIDA